MLHITNGDEVAEKLVAAGLVRPYDPDLPEGKEQDRVVAWRDLLFEGPLKAGLSPVNLGHERALYIASQGWQPYLFARQDIAERDAAVAKAKGHDEVILWFEHDLTDQLQLVQILDRWAARRPEETAFSWIVINRYPGIERFLGLGQLTAEQLAGLMPQRTPIPEEAFLAARGVWNALLSTDPTGLERAVSQIPESLPFLAPAIRRLLAEYPDARTGLSRTETLILRSIASGAATPSEIFRAVQEQEPVPFLPDRPLWNRLDWLATGPRPLIERQDGEGWVTPVVDFSRPDDPDMDAFHAQPLQLTDDGWQVLAGAKDWTTLRPVDRWIGGVHLAEGEPRWRWDAGSDRLVNLDQA